MKSTKKSLVVCGLSLLMCCALLVGTTFAWFTDSVVNKGNKIESGRLDVQLWNNGVDISDSTKPIFDYNLWEPGYSTGANLQVKNVGSLAVKYELELQNVSATKGLETAIDVQVNGKTVGTLSNFMNGENLLEGTLLPGKGSDPASIVLKMQEKAGNTYQNAEATFDILLKATQATHEQDGFGNPDYDQDASLDFIPVDSEEDFVTAVENAKANETVQLQKNLTLDQPIPQSGSGTTTIDLNGHTLGSTSSDPLIVDQGSSFTMKNGNLALQRSGFSPSCIEVNGTFTLEGVNYTAKNSSGILVKGDSQVNISNSTITADGYCISTNATYGSGMTISVKDSTLNAPLNTTSTGVLLNVPGTLLMENCTVNSKWQSVVVRGGDATLTNCTLNNLIDDDGSIYTKPDYKVNENWGQGNDLPNAALVVGNHSTSAYRYPATCTLVNTDISVNDGFMTVYAYGNSEEGCGASVNYDSASNIGEVIRGENVTVNGQ